MTAARGRPEHGASSGPSPSPPGRRNGEETARRILDAAATMFLKYGYEGTTMSRVAKEVGVSTPALYWHFDSKAVLAFAFMRRSLEAVISYVETRVTAEDPLEQLQQFVRAYVTYQLELGGHLPAEDTLYRHGFELLMGSLSREDAERLQQLRREPFDFLSRILETGIREGRFHVHDRPVTAQAIMSMCDYVFTWYRPGGRLGIPAVADVYALTACRMAGVSDPTDDDVGCRG